MRRLKFGVVYLSVFALLLGLFSFNNSMAQASDTNSFKEVDEAGLFVIEFIANDLINNEETEWSLATRIKDIIELYDDTDTVIGYSFELATEEVDNNGYIVVYMDEEGYYVHEFAYNERPFYYENIGEDFDRVYYTDGLEYTVSKNGKFFILEGEEVTKDKIKSKKPKNEKSDKDKNKKNIKEKVKKHKFKISEWMLGYNGQNTSADNSYAGIYDPYAYVNHRYGSGWSLKSSKTVSGVPKLLQSNYTGRDDCTIVSLTAIFSYWKNQKGYSKIPTTTTLYNDIKTIAKKYGYADIGGTPPTKINNIINDTWKKYGYSGTGSSLYVWSWSNFKTETDNNRPYLINMANGYYPNHTVTGVGYRIYQKSGRSDVNFILVYDNWTTSNRYIDKNAFSCCGSISRVYP